MKLLLFALAFFLSAVPVMAQGLKKKRTEVSTPWHFQLFFYSPEIRYERAEDQDLEQRKPHSYAVAVRRGIFSGLFEYSNFGDQSGNATLSIDREHKDYLLWGRMHYYNLNVDYFNLSLYAGLGGGFYQESVKTTLSGVSTTDHGDKELEGGAALGVDSVLTVQNNFGLMLGAELRLLFGRDFEPNPQVSGLLRVGVQF